MVSPLTALGLKGAKYETKDMWLSLKLLEDALNELLEELNSKKLDVIVCPTFACPAPFEKDPGRMIAALSYVTHINLLNLPSGVLPVSRITPNDSVRRNFCNLQVWIFLKI